jgi:hypothetical protein
VPALDVGAHLGLVAYLSATCTKASQIWTVYSHGIIPKIQQEALLARTRFKIVARNSHESCVDKGFHETHVGIRLIIGYESMIMACGARKDKGCSGQQSWK